MIRLGLALAAALLGGCTSVVPARADAPSLPADAPSLNRPEAAALARLVNAYRRDNGLPPVALSTSLTKVAEAHALDFWNSPDRGEAQVRGYDSRGIPCYSHTWTDRGPWTPVCYTRDNAYAAAMWSKPREITHGAYSGNGVEIAAWTNLEMDAPYALMLWRESPGHDAVIRERGAHAGARWQAMGVAVSGHYAFIWFGWDADPVDAAKN